MTQSHFLVLWPDGTWWPDQCCWLIMWQQNWASTLLLSIILSFFFAAKDFIRNLMEKDPNKRYTCEQAARHPW